MLHTMFLNEKPFDQIKNKSKTFEIRLYDEKRRALNIGDLFCLQAAPTILKSFYVR